MHDFKGSSSSAGVGNFNARGSINVHDNVMWAVSPYVMVGSGSNILGPSDHSVENWVAKGYGYGSLDNWFNKHDEDIQQMECTQHYESCTTYSKAGKYTVSLTVKNAKGSNTKTMAGYIVVSKKWIP